MTAPVVGVVGAGQLARMLQQPAIALGVRLRVLATSPADSAALVVPDVEVGDPSVLADLQRFAKGCDVLTLDHELVPPEHLQELERSGVVVRPSPAAVVHAQDKLVQRRAMARHRLPRPRFGEVSSVRDVTALGSEWGWPVVLKTVRGGYDGRGVHIVADEAEAEEVLARGVAVYAEQCVALDRELAAVVARRPSGEVAAWPVVETVQRDGICVEVHAPASGDVAERAARLATEVAEALGVTGVLAVELFDSGGELLVNELAMRPHNSAHWTIDASVTSQFEQHLRAVLDWPLGDTSMTAPAAAMVNLLGASGTDLSATLPRALEADRAVHVHLYGKQARPGRKIGHVTAVDATRESAAARARAVAAVLQGQR